MVRTSLSGSLGLFLTNTGLDMSDQLNDMLDIINKAVEIEKIELEKISQFLRIVNPDALQSVVASIQGYQDWCHMRLNRLNDAHSALVLLKAHKYPDRPLWRMDRKAIDELDSISNVVHSLLPGVEDFPVAEIVVGDAVEVVVHADA